MAESPPLLSAQILGEGLDDDGVDSEFGEQPGWVAASWMSLVGCRRAALGSGAGEK